MRFYSGVKFLLWLVFCSISALLLWRLLSSYDFSTLLLLSPKIMIGLLCVSILIIFLNVFYYKNIFDALYIRLHLENFLLIYFLSFSIGSLISSVFGSLSMIALIKKISQNSYTKATAVFLGGLFFRYLELFTFAVIGIIILGGKDAVVLLLVTMGVAAIFLAAIFFARRKFSLNRFIYKIIKPWRLLLNAKKSKLIRGAIIQAVSLCICAAVLTFILRYFHYSYNIFLVLCIQSIAAIVGTISLLPLGLGSYDITLVSLFVAMGIDKDTAISCVLIERAYRTFAPIFIGALIAGIILRRKISI